MEKSVFFGLLVLGLGISLVVTGCDTPTDPEPDRWTNVTSLNQLDGTWKGSYRGTESSDGITITTDVELTTIINASERLMSQTMNITRTFSGEGIPEAWDDIRTGIEQDFDEDITIVFDDEKYSVTMTMTDTSLIENENMDGCQINQDGTKLKISIEDPALIDLSELIFIKQ
jgi:hypothetical protein